MKRITFLLVAVILASLLIRMMISWQKIPVLVEKVLLDDSLYVISIAKNIAAGNDITYNGIDTTNGFQPLWGIMLVPVFLLTENINLAINLILSIASVIDTITILLVFLLARELFGDKVGIISAALYGLNPLIMFQTLCGIELVLFIPLVLTTIYFYHKNSNRFETKNLTVLGILIGLIVLARMDGIFLGLVISFMMLWDDRKDVLKGIRKILIVVIFGGIVIAPWFLWNYLTFGTIMQSSAIAKYNMGHGIFPFSDLKEPQTLSEISIMIGENIIRVVGASAHQLGIIDFNFSMITIALVLFLAITIVISLNNVRKFKVYFFFSILIILFYVLYLWGIQIRYVTPIIPLFIMLISQGLFTFSMKIKKSKMLLTAFVVLFVMVLFFNGLTQWEHGYFSWQGEIYKDALWIRENTEPSETIGVFSAGIPIYFSERKVINLDGVVNFKAIEALEKKNVIDYMKSENITMWYDSIYFNQTFTEEYLEGKRDVDILEDNIWVNFLGANKENLELVEQREKVYRHLRGFDMLVVFFKAKMN